MSTVLLATALAALILREEAAGAKGDGLKQSAWQPLCKISEELNKVGPNAGARLSKIATTAEDQSNTADRLTAFALLTTENNEAKKAVALAGLFTQLATENLQSLSTHRTAQTAINAVAENTYNKGRIDEALTILGLAKQGGGGCLVEDAGGSVAEVTGTHIGAITCSRKLKTPATEAYTVYDGIIGPQGWLTAHATTSNRDQSHSSGKTCKPLTTHAAGLAGGKIGAELPLAHGLLTVEHTDSGVKTVPLTAAETSKQARGNQWQSAYHGLKEIEELQGAVAVNATESAENQAALEEVINRATNNKNALPDSKPENLVLSLFPKPAHENIAKFIGAVEETKLKTQIAGIKPETKLRDVLPGTQISALTAALVIQMRQNIENLKKQQKNNAREGNHANADICAKIDDRKACEDKPYCSYNETKPTQIKSANSMKQRPLKVEYL
uniref:Variant surface glycoprotein 1125.1248 n=1 Tax=Trypanosoma brucei TaxID=5691 RepID=A0A1J0R6S2_9TRYP|nr:variant surface glycoprotein 1125.1248 [Trypanosoma brucei]